MEIILNTLQHQLQDNQIIELLRLGYEIINLRDANPELFSKLANSPSEEEEILELAEEFADFILNFPAVLLPLGSPAVMFATAMQLKDLQTTKKNFFFAHSIRISEDVPQPDGTIKKIQIFKHEKFLVL